MSEAKSPLHLSQWSAVEWLPIEGGGFAAWPRPRRLATLLALAAREDPPWKTRARRGFVGRPAVLRCAGIAGSVAVARSSELRSYVPVVAAVVATVAATGAAAASPARAVCARSRSPALTAIHHFSARWPLAAAMLAQAGRRQPGRCNRAGRAPAALHRRPLRRHATPRRSDSTRCRGRSPPAAAQPPVPRGSAAARLAQQARRPLLTGWAPDMSRPHRPRTAPHAQRGETTLLRATHRSYGKVLGGSAGLQRQQRAHTAVVWWQKSCWAPSGGVGRVDMSTLPIYCPSSSVSGK